MKDNEKWLADRGFVELRHGCGKWFKGFMYKAADLDVGIEKLTNDVLLCVYDSPYKPGNWCATITVWQHIEQDFMSDGVDFLSDIFTYSTLSQKKSPSEAFCSCVDRYARDIGIKEDLVKLLIAVAQNKELVYNGTSVTDTTKAQVQNQVKCNTNLTPRPGKVIVRVLQPKELPSFLHEVKRERAVVAEILSVGHGIKDATGALVPLNTLAKGMLVLVPEYAGIDISTELGIEVKVVDHYEIYAIVEQTEKKHENGPDNEADKGAGV